MGMSVMSVTCPVCGGQSQDTEFCDHCNADLLPPVNATVPQRVPAPFGKGRLTTKQRQLLSRPDSSLDVIATDGTRWRLHWLPKNILPPWLPLIEERARCQIAALPKCQRFEDSEGLWIAAESSGIRARPWIETPQEHPLQELRRLFRFASALGRTLAELHQQRLVWLNFDPAELEDTTAAGAADTQLSLRITNLDLEAYWAGAYPERLAFKPTFAAPEISRALPEQIGPATDAFHLAMFCYCWLARKLPSGFAGGGLEAFDYHIPPLRTFAADLAPGIADVVMHGLDVDVSRRFTTPAKFLAALGDAVARAEKRWEFTGPLKWDIGAHTRTGRAKSVAPLPPRRTQDWQGINEDSVLVKEFADPPRALLAVADGITTCDVGTGALASTSTVKTLEETFTASCSLEQFPELITRACQEGAGKLLQWALSHGHEAALRDGLDLMGTTLTAVWLQDCMLCLANLGDSRIYLVTDNAIEQLTVDGDLGSSLLAAGTPPEQVRDLGGLSKALRECIGGCQVNHAGDLVPLTDCLPTLSRCPLSPSDIVILCSDGLIEEGVFLDPATVLALVTKHRDLAAAQLATLLAERADALQRPPTPAEPEGFGDNISCIVIKVS